MTNNPKRSRENIRILIGILAAAIFLYSGYKVCNYYYEARQSSTVTDDLIGKAVETVQDLQPESNTEFNLVAEPTEYVPITVDFSILQAENEDIIAWIYCEDTPINYPIVQSKDNSYYLRRLTDGSWNMSGTLFLDFRCNADFSDSTSIVYGHNMKNDSMFGILPNYGEQSYFDQHPTMYLLTPETDYRVDLFAGFVTPADSEIYSLQRSDEERQAFITKAKEQSDFQADVEVTEDDCLLVLSTCSYEYSDARYVLIGKLTELPQ